MNLKFKPSISILFFVCFFASLSYSQSKKSIWNKVSEKELNTERLMSKAVSKKAKYYSLDMNELKTKLTTAPKRKVDNQVSEVIVDFPDENGGMNQYRIKEASIMAPDLQRKYPELKSFVGQNIHKPESTIRFSITPKGLNAMIFSSTKGTQYIDPSVNDRNIHTVYSKRDLSDPKEKFECGFEQENSFANKTNVKSAINANDGMMREFRLALATTIEYSAFHVAAAEASCGCTLTTEAEKKAAVMAELVVAMTRVNLIYERELSLTMILVGNNDELIFIDSDEYSNDNGNAMLTENQVVIDGVIETANYDIGHVFSTGGGGVAYLNSPCSTSKAGGVTGLGSPVGDPFYIDYVAHEMGHQFGAPHTFNSESGSCSGGNRTPSNAYEPGSGSTIMGYAGICSPQNVQATSDAYFHQVSLQMIWDNITSPTGSNCASLSATGNTSPIAQAGNSFTIPGLTPYKLSGSSTDVDGISSHTYTWEQYDLTTDTSLPSEINTTGPLLRSFEGTINPIRYVPNLTAILSNGGLSTTWEKLASVDRDINFQLTVRDNDSQGGQTATDNVTITVDGDSGPLKVLSQNTSGILWNNGATETISWDMANTNMAPVNTSHVNILLSLDGGQTFTETLVANTPNDGSENITVPNTPAPKCRIMIQPVDNIYFAINTENFALDYSITTECKSYSSAENLNITIPDNTGGTIFNTITIGDSDVIDYLSVNVDVAHSYINDLTIQLHHPNGTTFSTLWNKECFDENNLDITFKDGNPAIVCAQPTVGNYSPSTPLNVFTDLNSSGNWSISLNDNATDDTGVLNDWSIEICTTVTTVLNVEEEIFEGFKIFPNPSNGTINISLLTDQVEEVNIDLYDMTGRLIRSQKFARISQNFNEQFNYGTISGGIYILRISQGNNIISKRVVVN